MILAAATALWTASAAAQSTTVNRTSDLMRQCAQVPRLIEGEQLRPDELMEAVSCSGYVRGVKEGFEDALYMAGREASPFCNSRVSPAQLAVSFLLWAREHPEQWQQPPSTSVIAAMADRYPCRQRE